MDIYTTLFGKRKTAKAEEVKIKMKTINKRGIAYLDENGETRTIPPEAFAITEHIVSTTVDDNGVELSRIASIYYSFLYPIAEAEDEPAPKPAPIQEQQQDGTIRPRKR
jgi:hypothetical protein